MTSTRNDLLEQATAEQRDVLAIAGFADAMDDATLAMWLRSTAKKEEGHDKQAR